MKTSGCRERTEVFVARNRVEGRAVVTIEREEDTVWGRVRYGIVFGEAVHCGEGESTDSELSQSLIGRIFAGARARCPNAVAVADTAGPPPPPTGF